MGEDDQKSVDLGEHDDVAGIAGLVPTWTCVTCKLSALDDADLAKYPCEPNKYHPLKGEGQPQPLKEEKEAVEFLRFGNPEDTEVTIPENRSELASPALAWLQRVEDQSERVKNSSEEEKLRIAAEWYNYKQSQGEL